MLNRQRSLHTHTRRVHGISSRKIWNKACCPPYGPDIVKTFTSPNSAFNSAMILCSMPQPLQAKFCLNFVGAYCGEKQKQKQNPKSQPNGCQCCLHFIDRYHEMESRRSVLRRAYSCSSPSALVVCQDMSLVNMRMLAMCLSSCLVCTNDAHCHHRRSL